jgi:glutathione S-transferase
VLTLYTTPLSANGRKALAVARHLGLEAEIIEVDVYRGEGRRPGYLAIHPQGRIPALVDGDFTLWESNAILQYLAEAHGGCRLWSRDPARRADVSRWLFFEAAHWQPAWTAVLREFVGAVLLGRDAATIAAAAKRIDFADAPLRAAAALVDTHLHGRDFLVGDVPTLADFSVAAMLMYVRPAGFRFEGLPALGAWYARVEAIEAWRATAAGPWAY